MAWKGYTIGSIVGLVMLVNLAAAATPPPCDRSRVSDERVLAAVPTWSGWKPLATWKRVSVTIDTCANHPKNYTAHLVTELPAKTSTRGLSYRALISLTIDQRTGVPVDSEQNGAAVAALAKGGPVRVLVAESDPLVQSWLGPTPRVIAMISRDSATQAPCLSYARQAGPGVLFGRLRHCADGLAEFTFEDWSTLPWPGMAALRTAVEKKAPAAKLKTARLIRSGKFWRATISVTVAGESRDIALSRSDGAWR